MGGMKGVGKMKRGDSGLLVLVMIVVIIMRNGVVLAVGNGGEMEKGSTSSDWKCPGCRQDLTAVEREDIQFLAFVRTALMDGFAFNNEYGIVSKDIPLGNIHCLSGSKQVVRGIRYRVEVALDTKESSDTYRMATLDFIVTPENVVHVQHFVDRGVVAKVDSAKREQSDQFADFEFLLLMTGLTLILSAAAILRLYSLKSSGYEQIS